MNFKPILYSTDMVQALQEGRKTMTRRTQGLEEINRAPDKYEVVTLNIGEYLFSTDSGGLRPEVTIKAKYQKGDIIWVRESFTVMGHTTKHFAYKADLVKQGWDFKWKPSIHMPKAAARIFKKVTNVRVERLQQISQEDCIREGIKQEQFPPMWEDSFYFYPCNDSRDRTYSDSAKVSFYSLWRSINGQNSWDLNPWVFVYEFEVLDSARTDIAKAKYLK
ncbi:hypothetical protein [Jiulongibacter sp. NS-SX5]|uniref:hypothetical protein n=1 Tax=Jiulongibacter sp. NS-SX5 TaxID=3463854 RepID=UPI004059C546